VLKLSVETLVISFVRFYIIFEKNYDSYLLKLDSFLI